MKAILDDGMDRRVINIEELPQGNQKITDDDKLYKIHEISWKLDDGDDKKRLIPVIVVEDVTPQE